MTDYLSNYNYPLLILLACCIVPFILLLLASIFVLVRGQQLLRRDEAKLRRDFNQLQQRNANLNTAQLVQKIAHQQALRSGIIGAITSVGGLPILPLGLTIDLLTSAQLQTDMLHFIAWAYSQDANYQQRRELSSLKLNLPEVPVLKLNEVLSAHVGRTGEEILVRGSGELSRFALRRLLLIISEKAFAKVIPGIGLIIGFAVNYLSTRAIATLASQWYAGNIDKLTSLVKR
ncbi:MAG: hypothetical protein KF726_10880 [Anaerolineae bacterium]|nr:hypothetical protein [Anaerolineae bacterium]